MRLFFSFFTCSQRRAASGPIKAYMSLFPRAHRGKNQKIGIGCIPQRAARALYNTALTDGHLILTVVFPQMEMFFLLPALCRDEVVGLLFVTRADMLWMSCSFMPSTLMRHFASSTYLFGVLIVGSYCSFDGHYDNSIYYRTHTELEIL